MAETTDLGTLQTIQEHLDRAGEEVRHARACVANARTIIYHAIVIARQNDVPLPEVDELMAHVAEVERETGGPGPYDQDAQS